MTTKKVVVIVVGVLVVLGLIVVVSAGGIVGFMFYSIGKSDAATVARTYLQNNEKLKQDIGDVKDFGSFVSGSINVQNSEGAARLKLKVIGTRKTVNATVDLSYRSGRPWHVVGASYTNEQGDLIDLLNPYDSKLFLVPLAA
jgi:hypothetical protein